MKRKYYWALKRELDREFPPYLFVAELWPEMVRVEVRLAPKQRKSK